MVPLLLKTPSVIVIIFSMVPAIPMKMTQSLIPGSHKFSKHQSRQPSGQDAPGVDESSKSCHHMSSFREGM